MRLSSWLKSICPQLSSPAGRRQGPPSWKRSAIVERLEPRQLLSPTAVTVGLETLVNSHTLGDQNYSRIATDAAGDYLVVWQSAGQDGSGKGIYAQRYNAAGVAQGGEFQVNTYTTGDQQSPAVAMDSAGDFVITWQSYGQDGNTDGIFAQRYNAAGTAQGSEFQVNTYTSHYQQAPSVAMDATGDFVITWQSGYQDGDRLGVYAQRYSAAGTAQGSEFRVNSSTTGDQSNPSAAMDAAGDFVIAWASNQRAASEADIFAQRYDATGTAQGTEFRVNTNTTASEGPQSVAMDAAGDFVIAWTMNFTQSAIEAQRYNAAGVAQGGEFRVNNGTTGDVGASVAAMDSAGNFVITWQKHDVSGQENIEAQLYDATGAVRGSMFGVNTDTVGIVNRPTIALDASGDFVVAWQSRYQTGSGYDVYSQRFQVDVNPIVTAVLRGTGAEILQSSVLHNGETLTSSVGSLSVAFSENLNAVPGGPNSVTNPSNWELFRYGVDISNLIGGYISFGYNSIIHRYVANVQIGALDGGYLLVARQKIHDLAGEPLDGAADGSSGGDFRFNFYVSTPQVKGSESIVNSYTTSDQRSETIASDAAGDYVVAWASNGQDGSGDGVYARRFNLAGVAQGAEFRVNTYTTGNQNAPSVAMDATGDFVIAWQSNGQDGDGYGVYERRYNAAGVAQGAEFAVNTYTTGIQNAPRAAMDVTGDFVIAWQSNGQDGNGYGVYARRFNAAGVPQGAEFRINAYTTGNQNAPAVAMDAAGNFVIAWQSYGQDGANYGVYAKRYSARGIGLIAEYRLNQYTTGNQNLPAIAMDPAGDYVIAWQSEDQDGSEYGVYAATYDAVGNQRFNENRINSYTTGNQFMPAVAMDAAGDVVVTWQSTGQDGSGDGVYAQRFDSEQNPQGNEFRVNTYTTGNQNAPAAAMDAVGNLVIAWQSNGQDGGGYGVFAQHYNMDIAPWLYGVDFAAPLSAVGASTTPIAPSLLVFDADSADWTGATIQITSGYQSHEDVLGFTNSSTPGITASWNVATGTLTLSGADTVSDYRTALRNVTYHDTSNSPDTAVTRTIEFRTTDGRLWSNVVSRDVTLATSSTPAVLSGVSGTGTYVENDPWLSIAAGLLVTDPDAVYLNSATVAFTNWQGEDRVTFNNIFALQHTFTQNLTTHTASLTITGTDTVDHYQTLLRSVVYSDVSDNPVTTMRIASFTVSDGLSISNAVSRGISVVSVNDPPLLSAIETTPLAYKANDPAFPAQPISATLLASDPDSINCSKATIWISGGYQNNSSGHDVLSFASMLGITGVFDASTGTLTLSGTSGLGNYRTAIRSVTFSASGSAVSTAVRTLTITATDDFSPTPATSLPVIRKVTVTTTNIPPGLTGMPSTALTYFRGAAPLVLAPGLYVLDPDSINLTGATIQVTTNYQNGQDVLGFSAGSGITGSFDAGTGKLTLSGTASLASYQAVMRTIAYKTNTSAANTATRTISFTVNDGLALSSPVSCNVDLI